MSLVKTHKIALAPTPAQGALLAQHAGYARVAYNHALADFKACLDRGEWLTDMDLRPRFNAQKREVYPWCAALSQNASKYAVIAVGDAVKAWKSDKQANHFPVFKSRRRHRRAFRADNGPDTVRCVGNRIQLAKIGAVKMREELRFEGSIREVTIVQDAGRWFACVTVRTADLPLPLTQTFRVGVDVGVKTLATCSDGRRFDNPRALKRNERKLRRVDKSIARSRNVHGKNRLSRRRTRKYRQRERLHVRISNLRTDAQHKATTAIAVTGGVVVIEDLNVRGMVRNRKLAKAVSDSAMSSFLAKLTYKTEWYGAEVKKVSRWFPSSKLCRQCGVINDQLTLADRVFRCECGYECERDLNAAINLRDYDAASLAESLNGRGGYVSPPAAAAEAREASTQATPSFLTADLLVAAD